MTAAAKPEASKPEAWRTPAMIVLSGCLIALLSFGPRSAAGQFLTPLSFANGWGRDVFSMAFAIQNLVWGIAQPFAGAVADRFGTVRVLCTGGILYGLGLAIMAYAANPLALDVSAGLLIGFGLAGCSFNLVLSAFGKLVPEAWRSLSLGAGTAAGSFGQFLFSPLARVLIDSFGWQQALLIFAAGMLLVLSRSRPHAPRPGPAAPRRNPSGRRSRRRSGIAPMFCWCWASSPAGSSSPSSPCICRPIWSIAVSPPRSAAGPSG
jgi:MFS family permease